MKKLLVTGASGFLGSQIPLLASGTHTIYGTGFRRQPSAPDLVGLQTDLSDRKAVEALFSRVSPEAVIHAAAQANPAACEQTPEAARAANVTAAANIAAECGRRGIPLVFTSTDMVFDGRDAPYAEDAPPAPLSLYGRLKAEAEAEVRRLCPQACVCRLPLLFGATERESPPRAGNFFLTMVQALLNKTPLTLFSDEFRTPLYAVDAVKGLLLALDAPGRILHLAGPQRVSRYAFGKLLAAALRRDPSGFTPLPLARAGLAGPRPADVSLRGEDARALGFAPRPLSEAVAAAARDALRLLEPTD
jgi:dTDP-4-dehydrorhamnose reductase